MNEMGTVRKGEGLGTGNGWEMTWSDGAPDERLPVRNEAGRDCEKRIRNCSMIDNVQSGKEGAKERPKKCHSAGR